MGDDETNLAGGDRGAEALRRLWAIGLAFHWFAFLVKIWHAVMLNAVARSMASA